MEATTNTSTAVQISKATLTNMVESGAKRDEIAKTFGLNTAQTVKLLKQAGLTIRKFHKPQFNLID